MAGSVRTRQLTLSIAFVQVTTSVAIMQVLRFYYNYAGCSVVIIQLKLSAALTQVTVSEANMWVKMPL